MQNYRPPAPPVDPTRPAPEEPSQVGVPDAFGDERGVSPSVLVEIGVRVSWLDLGVDKWVERTTWVFDREAASGLVGSVPSIPGAPPVPGVPGAPGGPEVPGDPEEPGGES
jgi:hypothetical protein